MKTRNKLLTLLILSAGAATTTALINKAVKLSAVSKHILESRVSRCYRWRLGNIRYCKDRRRETCPSCTRPFTCILQL